ncbi:asparagine synthase (glutamine-hydrolyzing) [Chitinophaga sp. Ak27]|uniref:asparagine synthase (glutamine-hydrolyzing) n=1 Tax=Chitinophaga sp. Ak27 TaxID=2726116 RepID=UPI00145F6513|nr:asparagine synthase (glutamine-hydrolyzing) [Chitinophaga sp. Ak27]NLU93264.1 asparagine synthase (glutamine-hydrolyzing) [Chitinophaga sp. Ak27]
MCGICGIVDLSYQGRKEHFPVITGMTEKLRHRGPDSNAFFYNDNFVFGFSRLSIIDLKGGMQPISNEDDSIVLICNGEIFNFIELRQQLTGKGHLFKTGSDVEVILHLYEEYGTALLDHLNGQFSFALFDLKNRVLLCARDHFGITPFYYTVVNNYLVFASEIKSILAFPEYRRKVDLTGLDQVFTFPGMVGNRTLFEGVLSLKNGHFLRYDGYKLEEKEYWDLIYPTLEERIPVEKESYYIEGLNDLINNSIRLRLRSDTPVGLYLSGGLDSSLIAAKAKTISPQYITNAYSIVFGEKDINEEKYQHLLVQQLQLKHYKKLFNYTDITTRLPDAVYFCECPIKESYNTASMALSEMVHDHDYRVILSGEGADEFFAGYVGYRFDKIRQLQPAGIGADSAEERAIRARLWGDEDFFYEKNKSALTGVKRGVYAAGVRGKFDQFDCLQHFVVNNSRLANRHILHKRAYLDYKLRLVDHLLSDHGDRMGLANSVEVRYPFLDRSIAEFAARIPPDLKLNDFEEKYILKKIASAEIPMEIVNREKFGFVAPGSPYILKRNVAYINDLLSYDTVKRQGYFDPEAVQALVKQYSREDFHLNIPFDSDLLMIIITFGILLDKFDLPDHS